MNNFKKITLEEFIDAYNSHPPNSWIRFAFKYFSKSTERKNMKLNNVMTIILLSLFGFGMLGTILGWSRAIVGSAVIIYSVLLTILVLFLLIAVWMNNSRIKKIAKSLDITLEQYGYLSDKYF